MRRPWSFFAYEPWLAQAWAMTPHGWMLRGVSPTLGSAILAFDPFQALPECHTPLRYVRLELGQTWMDAMDGGRP